MKCVVGRYSEVRQIGKFCFTFSPLFLACLQELGLQDSLLWGSNGELRLSPLLLGSVIGTLWSGVGSCPPCTYLSNLVFISIWICWYLLYSLGNNSVVPFILLHKFSRIDLWKTISGWIPYPLEVSLPFLTRPTPFPPSLIILALEDTQDALSSFYGFTMPALELAIFSKNIWLLRIVS